MSASPQGRGHLAPESSEVAGQVAGCNGKKSAAADEKVNGKVNAAQTKKSNVNAHRLDLERLPERVRAELAMQAPAGADFPSLAELVGEALEQLHAAGLAFDALELDTGWRRQPKADHLWYIADSGTSASGRPWLLVTAGDARQSGDVCTPLLVYRSWQQPHGPASPDEALVIAAQVERQRQQRAEHERERRAKSARQALEAWNTAPAASDNHPYLIQKGVPALELRQQGDALLVPLRDADAVLHGLQRIGPDGAKRFNRGANPKGHYHLLGAPEPGGVVQVAEGYATAASIHLATGDPVAVAFNAGNLKPVAEALRARDPAARLVICADDDYATAGNPGITHARAAAAAVNAVVAVPVFAAPADPERGTDFNDLATAQGTEAVHQQIQAVLAAEPSDTVMARLAGLAPLEYDRVREAEAKRLGVRAGTLDKEVARARSAAATRAGAGDLVEVIEPWAEAVAGAALLDGIAARLRRYMILPDGAAHVLALWTLGSYVFDAFPIFPKLLITSPEKRCGKSTLLNGLLGALVHRAMVASNISPAAVFRVIDACRPSLLIDEADTFIGNNDELRGVINSGHTKSGAFVVRTVGDDHEPKRFSTWSPMAIAMIKTPAGTIVDRSILIRLRRRLPGEQVERIPLSFADDCLVLRRRCLRWAQDHQDDLARADPQPPQTGNDRAVDNWRALLAIAELAGGDWPRHARRAFALLNDHDDDDDIGPMILADIRDIFTTRRLARIHSAELVAALVAMEERPWCEWRRGFPLSVRGLANLLKPYGIKAKQLYIGSVNLNGYDIEQLRDAFDRYLDHADSGSPPAPNSITLEASNGTASSRIAKSRGRDDLELEKRRKPSNDAGSRVIEYGKGGGRADCVIRSSLAP